MVRIILGFLLIITIGCKKDIVSPNNDKVEQQEQTTKPTSFVPFTNYRGLAFIPSQQITCTGAHGRTYLNINNNSKPDLIISRISSCSAVNDMIYVYMDGELKWQFEIPQAVTRKIVKGDFNEDGYDDVVLFGHGYDYGDFPGDKNYIIYFTPTSYKIALLDSTQAFHHTGVATDINNDGHLDIIPNISFKNIDCYAYLNDGKGNFTKKKVFDASYTSNSFTMESFDFNHDGNMDIIIGGNEWMKDSINVNRIIYGDGKGSFDISKQITLPTVDGWGVITDFDFVDLDKDGVEEIVVTRTFGVSWKIPEGQYGDFRIQVLKKSGNTYVQSTLLSSPVGYENVDKSISWLNWINTCDVDGDGNLDIVPDSDWLNDSLLTVTNKFYKLYYKGDGKGNFAITYAK